MQKMFVHFIVFFAVFFVQATYAATWEVTSSADSGAGSLRQTLDDAASGDVLYFDAALNGGTISLASEINAEIDDKNITIDAMSLSNGIIITGASEFTNGIYFDSAGYTLTIRGITFDDAADHPIMNGAGTSVVVDYCTFKNNDNSLGWSWGGGIHSAGNATIVNSTFNDNSITSGHGGALAFSGDGTIIIKNCTFNNNSVDGGSFGAVIHAESYTKLIYITNCTFSDNDSPTQAGSAINSLSGSKIWLKNNIFWNNGSQADFNTSTGSIFVSDGYNIFQEDPSGVFDEIASDIVGDDPSLGVLADNGGRTQTCLPGDDAAADTNRIPGADMTVDEDQRGYARGQGAGGSSTIGAVELTSDGTAAATTNALRTVTINKTGTGTGTITSAPGTIDCGATCDDAVNFNARSSITLTSAPAGGSYTVNWSGGDYETDADTCIINYPHDYIDIYVKIDPPSINYSKKVFPEEASNTGSITETSAITLVGDTFTGGNSDDFVSDGKVTVSNLAAGLTAVVTRVSATELALSFTGNAVAHTATDAVTDLTLTFLDTAFTGGSAAGVENAESNDLTLRFYDANLSYAPLTFSEASTNDGAVLETVEITLFGDTFSGADNEDFVSNSKVSVANLPAGLTAVVKQTETTSAYIYFTGNAASHLDADTITDLQLTFADTAFTGGSAAAVLSATSPQMTMNFFTSNPTSPRTITYTNDTFSEGSSNTGTVPDTIDIILYGDRFTGNAGNDLVEQGKVLVTNLPPGLTANVIFSNLNLVTLSFGGTATSNDSADSIANLTLSFQDGAFAGNDNSVVTGAEKNDLAIDFDDAVTVAATVTTQAASAITATTAKGNGNITGLGSPNPTAHGICYGTSVNPTVPGNDEGAASATGAFTSDLSGLTPSTTYHVRAFATNTAGTSYGTDVSFTTSDSAPVATTDAASGVTATGVTLNGTVNASNQSSTITFEYGLTTAYGTTVTADQSPATGSSNTSVTYTIGSLTPSTAYHYRVVAVNGTGTTNGADETFTTSADDDGTVSGGDSDGDGISDSDEGSGDTDSDGIPDSEDEDSDNDGISDALEGNIDTDGDGTPDYKDTEADGDGIDDELEQEAANNGDGNADGIPDRLQSNVASLRTYDETAVVTLASPAGSELVDVEAIETPAGLPEDDVLAYGLFQFTITGVGLGGSADLVLYLPENARPDSYLKYGPVPGVADNHWYDFSDNGVTGAEINDNVVTLHLTDGEWGDDNLVEDGMIIDAGGPEGTETSGDNNGSCFIGSVVYP